MSLWPPTDGACVAPDLNWSVMVKAGTRRDVGLKSPQWGLKSMSNGPQGTHGCSTQEAARFCECQRVNKACHASLTSVSYDQHYGRSISVSVVMVIQIVDLPGFIDIKNGDIWAICVYSFCG